MKPLVALLTFLICAADCDECLCTEGHTAASSCAVAEQHVREGMLPHQVLTITGCDE